MAKKTAIFISILLLLSLSACSSKEKELTRHEGQFLELFDTVTQIIAYTESEEEFNAYQQLVFENTQEMHQLYDIYNDYEGINNIKTINDNAGIAPVKVDQRIIDLLKFGKEAYEFTNGKTNIAMGSVLRIWHDHREAGLADPAAASLPNMEELKQAALHTDINNVIIDEAASTVYLKDPDMRLDVGAIAKGYAAEQDAQIATKAGYTGLLSLGGNVRATGFKGDGKTPWAIGIQDPFAQGESSYLYLMEVTDRSLVTSGDYERYYEVDGKRYHHIIDPVTLLPADYFTSVSILCVDSGVADAWSTALFNMSYEEGLKLVEADPDVEALWIFKDGTMKDTSGFQDLILQ